MSPRPLTLSRIDETFYQVVAAVVAETLEACGHVVTVRDGSHTEAYDLLERGEADLTVAYWLPTGHAKPWARIADKAVELATLYEGAQFFWAVPETAPAELRSVEDLARPEAADSFPKTIRGLSLDATITTASMTMVDAYGLAPLGFHVEAGGFEPWKAALEAAIREGTNVIVPLWRPYYFNALYPLRQLAEPKGILGGENRVVLAATRGAAADLPAATLQALRTLGLTLDAVTAMDFAVNTEERTPEAAAKEWRERRA